MSIRGAWLSILLFISSGWIFLHPSGALAACSLSGSTYICMDTTTSSTAIGVGGGRNDNGKTLNVAPGATISTTNFSAISLGNNNTITVGPNAQITTTASGNTTAGGGFGTGPNTIEAGANTTINIGAGAIVSATGGNPNSEAINVHGFGNTIINNGTIFTNNSSAIFLQNDSSIGGSSITVPGRGTFSNVIENFGTITAAPGPDSARIQQAIGVTPGTNNNVYFLNEENGVVDGNLNLAGGNDTVELLPGSSITGNLDGGSGTDTLILNSSISNPDGEINGRVNSFEIINKVGNGAWLITGDIVNSSGSVAVNVQDGQLILTSNNLNFNGSMTIDPGGTLQLGNGGTSGNINANILNNGTVAFDRSDNFTFGNVISGSGIVEQNGTGITTLTAVNTYSGGTFVNTGTLAVGDAAHTGAALAGGGPVIVAAGATLTGYGSITGNVTNHGTMGVANALPAFNSDPSGNFTINGNLTNNGAIHIGGGENTPANQLVVNGNYAGNGGTMYLNTVLGSDNSPSDKLVINGGTATGTTFLRITNVGGSGAATTGNGILVVSTLNGATTTPNAFVLEGEARGGAFDYALQQGGNGLTRAFVQDWFLRNEFIVPGPPGTPTPTPPGPNLPVDPPPGVLPPGDYPIIGPEIATYGVVQPLARQLGTTALGTLHERRGDTLLDTSCAAESRDPEFRKRFSPTNSNCTDNGWGASPVWGRVLGQQVDNRYHAFAEPGASGQILGFQSGIDLWRGSFLPGHQDIAGLYFSYSSADVDVSGLVADVTRLTYVMEHTGHLNLDAWSGGAYWTHYGPSGWYLDAVTQFTRYDAIARTQFANLDTAGNGFIGSLETGYPFALPMLGPGFVLEPQAQILWQQMQFNDANDGLGEVALGTTSGATGRIGLRGRWTFTTDQGQQWQPYVRVNYWQDWGARATTVYSGVDEVPLLEQASRVQVGGGVTARITPRLTLYANADYQFEVGQSDGTRRNGVDATAGVSFKW